MPRQQATPSTPALRLAGVLTAVGIAPTLGTDSRQTAQAFAVRVADTGAVRAAAQPAGSGILARTFRPRRTAGRIGTGPSATAERAAPGLRPAGGAVRRGHADSAVADLAAGAGGDALPGGGIATLTYGAGFGCGAGDTGAVVADRGLVRATPCLTRTGPIGLTDLAVAAAGLAHLFRINHTGAGSIGSGLADEALLTGRFAIAGAAVDRLLTVVRDRAARA